VNGGDDSARREPPHFDGSFGGSFTTPCFENFTSFPTLFTEIAAGHPVIVLQNLAFDWYPVWHYAVAVGYDLDAQEITLRSGRERRLQLPLGTFEDTWRRGGHWAMLALPPLR